VNDRLYVGPARVLSVEQGRPRVQVLGGSCEVATADWALPFQYQAQVGDLLLVMGREHRYWVTGIVHGAGRSQLAFRGDTELGARDGGLQLSADGGLRVQSPSVHIAAAEFETDTATTHQRIDEHDQEVIGRFDERAGESTREIDGEDAHTSARSETVAAHVAKVDGGLLRLS